VTVPQARSVPELAASHARSHSSLAWRIGLAMGAVVLVVLLVTGLVVNRVVSAGFDTVQAAQQQERLAAAADAFATLLEQPRGAPLRILNAVRRLAATTAGQITLTPTAGNASITVGQRPASSAHYEVPVEADGQRVGTIVAELPSTAPDRGFLRFFNLALVIGGLAAVIVILLLAGYLSRRLTQPLQTVADAARRLGGGDLAARAHGGPDQESAELADAFNAMGERLQRSEMLRRRAASDMAHDLATPATVLESQLQAMIDGVVPADREQLEAARSAAAALGSVVAQMGELASAESAPLQQRAARVDVAAAVVEVGRGLEGLYRERGVTLAIDPPGAAPLVASVDPDHLGRALRNVLTNAAQYSPTGSSVRVTLAGTATEIQIRVIDAGPGIAAEDVPHVFERFYRADRSRAVDPETGRRTGSGIGLTIARELLAANGGSIEVERSKSDGASMLIRLARSTYVRGDSLGS
jgi:two-component system, OmpR family, sensor histidine kinase BaeS